MSDTTTPAPTRNGTHVEKVREAFFSWNAARFYLAAAGVIVAAVLFVWRSQAAQDSEIAGNRGNLMAMNERHMGYERRCDEVLAQIRCDIRDVAVLVGGMRQDVAAGSQMLGAIERRLERLEDRVNRIRTGCAE